MYESFFGFVKRPFLAASTLDRYFPASGIEQTFQIASRAIQRAEGPIAIFGGTGLGKTMCCLRIADSFRRNFEVVMLSSAQLITRRALLQSLLFELRMPYRDMSEGELRLTLMSRLQPSTDNPTDGLVLVIDEAQTMSMKLLDEIRLLTNVVRNGVPRVRLVLCGTMRLEDCLSHPHMDSLNQRLAARCYLTPLSSQETSQYVIHKIELSGVEGSSVMTRDALDAIYRGSDGIPRLIDQLADQSLLLACHDRERPVSAAMVGRAWCMLQQLPNPWSEPESIAKASPLSIANATSSIANGSQPPTTPTPIASAAKSDAQTNSASASAFPSNTTTTTTTTTPAPSAIPSPVIMQPTIQPSMPSGTVSASGFQEFMKGSAGYETRTTSTSNIEFGELGDEFLDETESGQYDHIGPSAPIERQLPIASDFEEPVQVSNAPSAKSKNMLDVFSGDFDEEFSIPVQSSDSYQAYSGASYGNLNYDISNFATANRNPMADRPLAFDEASDFLSESVRPTQSVAPQGSNDEHAPYTSAIGYGHEREFSVASYEDSAMEAISNISPEQAANLERQIEEEMRELVSDLNMSAMTFDPASTINPYGTPNAPSDNRSDNRADNRLNDRQLAYRAHTDVIAFSGMHSFSNLADLEQEPQRAVMGDDRDLLVIEDDVEAVRGGSNQGTLGQHRAVLHPYAKLFSKLRNS